MSENIYPSEEEQKGDNYNPNGRSSNKRHQEGTSWTIIISRVVICIVIIFLIVFGITKLVGGGSSEPVAVVNGDQITQSEFSQQIAQQKKVLHIQAKKSWNKSSSI